MKQVTFSPIGVVHSPFMSTESTPRWGSLTEEEAVIEVYASFEDALDGIEDYELIEVLFHFHLARRDLLRVVPPHRKVERGVFATRAPHRPNPIGLTPMRLIARDGRFLRVRNVDVVDGTPVLDIKPYQPETGSVDVKETDS